MPATVLTLASSAMMQTPPGTVAPETILDNTTGAGDDMDIWKDAKPPYWSMPVTIILSATICVIILLAVLGNALVMLVIMKHRGMRTRTNMFLCNLAITDLLCGIINMPVSMVTVIKGQWVFGAPDGAFCQFNGFTMPLLFVTSIHTLMYISIHKYISITRPFSRVITYGRIFIMIGIAWSWAILSGYVTVHGLTKVVYKPYTTQCGPEYPHDLKSYMLPVFICVTCYLLPFAIMTFCYARVFSEIRAHSARLEKHTNQEKDTIFLQQRRITMTLFLVLIIFVLSWTPYIIYSVYASMLKDKSKINHNFNAISYWFSYMNSACNPIIYALRSPAFREGYKEIMCRTRALITSEETDPFEAPGPLRKFRAFLRHSLHGTEYNTTSQSGSFSEPGHKPSLSSLTNIILQPYKRSLSTSSLPGSFKFKTGEAPKVSMIGGTPVITVGGKIVYFKDPSLEQARKKRISPVYYPDSTQSEADKDNGFKPLEMVGDNGVIPNGNIIKEKTHSNQNMNQHDESGDMTEPLLASEEKQQRENAESGAESNVEDDNVFVVCAEVEPGPNQYLDTGAGSTPRIQITSDEDETVEFGQDEKEEPAGVAGKRKYTRSMSEHQSGPTEEEENEIETLTRSTSEMVINGKEKEPTSRGLKRWIFSRLFTKSKERLKSTTSIKSNKSSSSSMKSKKGDSVRKQSELKVPKDGYKRSLSDDARNKRFTSEGDSGLDDDELPNAISDTVLDSDHQCLMKRLKRKKDRWLKKSGEVRFQDQGGEHVKLEATDSALRRAYSDKPRLSRYPSVEKLDRRKRKKGTDSSSSRRHTHAELSDLQCMETDLGNSEEQLEFSEREFDRKLSLANFDLYRSISDPCLTFNMIESKVANRRATKKWKKRGHRHRGCAENRSDDGSDGLSALLREYQFSSRPSSRESLGEPFEIPVNLLQRTCVEFELSRSLVKDGTVLPRPISFLERSKRIEDEMDEKEVKVSMETENDGCDQVAIIDTNNKEKEKNETIVTMDTLDNEINQINRNGLSDEIETKNTDIQSGEENGTISAIGKNNLIETVVTIETTNQNSSQEDVGISCESPVSDDCSDNQEPTKSDAHTEIKAKETLKPQLSGHYHSTGALDECCTEELDEDTISRISKTLSDPYLDHLDDPVKRHSFMGMYSEVQGKDKETVV